MREEKIEAYLVRRVKELGGEVRKVKWLGRKGAPDRLVLLPEARKTVAHDGPKGRTYHDRVRPACAVWVELKAPGKVPDPIQVREHERLRAYGQRVEVIDTLEGVDNFLKEMTP